MKKIVSVFVCLMMVLSLGACASYDANMYTGDEARVAQSVQYGTVLSVRPVTIRSESASGLGTVGGAVAGGFLGSTIGGGSGSTIAAVAGALLGAGAGYFAGEQIGREQGLEIMVRLDSGGEISVVQGAKEAFAVGARVRVLTGNNGVTRVTY